MASLDARLLVLETRRTPAGAWPELIVLHSDESLSAVQQAELDRVGAQRQPMLVVRISAQPAEKLLVSKQAASAWS